MLCSKCIINWKSCGIQCKFPLFLKENLNNSGWCELQGWESVWNGRHLTEDAVVKFGVKPQQLHRTVSSCQQWQLVFPWFLFNLCHCEKSLASYSSNLKLYSKGDSDVRALAVCSLFSGNRQGFFSNLSFLVLRVGNWTGSTNDAGPLLPSVKPM